MSLMSDSMAVEDGLPVRKEPDGQNPLSTEATFQAARIVKFTDAERIECRRILASALQNGLSQGAGVKLMHFIEFDG